MSRRETASTSQKGVIESSQECQGAGRERGLEREWGLESKLLSHCLLRSVHLQRLSLECVSSVSHFCRGSKVPLSMASPALGISLSACIQKN